MLFDFTRAAPTAKTAFLVLIEKAYNSILACATRSHCECDSHLKSNNSLGGFGRVFEVHRDLPDICEGVIPFLALEGRRGVLILPQKHRLAAYIRVEYINTYDHFVDKYPQCPPVDGGCVSLSCNNLRCNVF
jgi:hypothetical protein